MATVTKSADQIRQEITNKMVEAISAGLMPWRQPWVNSPNAGTPCNFRSGRRYSGINPLLLSFSSMLFEFSSRHWGPADGWLHYVGAVVKNEQCPTWVTFFRMVPKRNSSGAPDRDSKGRPKMIPLLREFPLYNVEQLEAPSVESLLNGQEVQLDNGHSVSLVKAMLGKFDARNGKPVTRQELRALAKKYVPARQQPAKGVSMEFLAQAVHNGIQKRLGKYLVDAVFANNDPDFGPAERLIKASGANIVHGGSKAEYTYRPVDKIKLPNKRSFKTGSDYYQTAFHELLHWTEDKDRVGQAKGHNYAFGELVAEIGASFLLMEIGVPLADKMLERSQSYVSHWLREMKNDPKYIFMAAAQASKGVDYLLDLASKKQKPKKGKSGSTGTVAHRDVA